MESLDFNESVVSQAGETATLHEHQRALYSLLLEFDRVAKKLNINYFIFAGTLLGAVRHRGFIPWDDDLDVIMRREEYERFMREAPAILDQNSFFLQAEYSDHWPLFYSKLRINGTTCLEKYHPKDKMIHQGVYMDIFPCDNAYSSRLGRIIQFAFSKIVIAKGLDRQGYANTNCVKKVFMLLCRILPLKPVRSIVKGPRKAGKYLHSFLACASKYSRNVYPVEVFEGHTELRFEDSMFSAPKEYDCLLKILYGDYMTVPSVDQRQMKKHAILVDLTKSYEEYEHYREGMSFDVHTRSIR